MTICKNELSYNGKPIHIGYIEFPESIRGAVFGFTSARSDSYVVIVDASLPPEDQQKTLGHELAHIYLSHFDKRILTQVAREREADAAAEEYYKRFAAGELGSWELKQCDEQSFKQSVV